MQKIANTSLKEFEEMLTTAGIHFRKKESQRTVIIVIIETFCLV